MKKVFTLLIGVIIAHSSFAQKEENKSNNSIKKIEKMETKKNSELQSFNEYQEVVKALEPYIKSASTSDEKLCRSAFHDHAHIIGSIDGEVYLSTADEFAKIVASDEPSKTVQHHIVWIDISGPAAAAKVEFIDWGGFRFTDFFVLYKKDGEWKISGKVYDSHSRN